MDPSDAHFRALLTAWEMEQGEHCVAEPEAQEPPLKRRKLVNDSKSTSSETGPAFCSVLSPTFTAFDASKNIHSNAGPEFELDDDSMSKGSDTGPEFKLDDDSKRMCRDTDSKITDSDTCPEMISAEFQLCLSGGLEHLQSCPDFHHRLPAHVEHRRRVCFVHTHSRSPPTSEAATDPEMPGLVDSDFSDRD